MVVRTLLQDPGQNASDKQALKSTGADSGSLLQGTDSLSAFWEFESKAPCR